MTFIRLVSFCIAFVALPAAGLAGCGGDGCAELAEICDLCPDTPDGLVAQDSCERTVASGDDESCASRIDDDTYAQYGCQ